MLKTCLFCPVEVGCAGLRETGSGRPEVAGSGDTGRRAIVRGGRQAAGLTPCSFRSL